jgi:hypothetical protein
MRKNNARRSIPGFLIALAVAMLVASCGGGGGGGGGGFGSGDDPGTASGTITGFGSVFVNGVEWDTSGAAITVDDAAGIESDLRAGQIVTLRGTLDDDGVTAEADSVEVDSILEGPVLLIDTAGGTLVVLDQVVLASADTSYDDSIPDRVADGRRALDDLQTGDVIEVSGYRDAQTAVRATRIGIRSGGGAVYEVTGRVSNVQADSFQIGALVVDRNGLQAPVSGDLVEVEGTLNGAVLEATRIEAGLDAPDGDSGDQLEVEGFITAVASATDFSVGKYDVMTDGATEFDGGTAAGLVVNAKVEVEGELDSSGNILADRVEFRVSPDDTNVEVAGFVSAVNAAAGTVTIEGLGVVAQVDAATRLEDRTGNDGVLTLAELAAGDYVEVRGVENESVATNDVRATRLERLEAGDEVILRGPVQEIDEPDLRILGVIIQSGSATFRDVADDPISQTEFFDTLIDGDVVKASAPDSAVAGSVMVAEELEIEEAG